MSYDVRATITPRAAAKLLISGEIALDTKYDRTISKRILQELLNLPVEELLSIIDQNRYGTVAEVKSIPQFGTIETLLKVPAYFQQNGNVVADYVQLGFFLKQDINASLQANCKFGENHGKTAALLGLAYLIDSKITPSSFTSVFTEFTYTEQNNLIRRLMLRVPIIQIIIKNARNEKFNGYAPMCQLMKSTQHRRGTNVRGMLKALKELNCADLNSRIENITWEDC